MPDGFQLSQGAYRPIQKVLVIEMPDGTYIEVASDHENIDALVELLRRIRDVLPEDQKNALLGPGWLFPLDTREQLVTSSGTVVREWDSPEMFPSPVLRGLLQSQQEGEDDADKV